MSSLIESIITSIQNNMLFALAVVVLVVFAQVLSLAIIFKKIGHKALYAFIPVYNIMKLMEILDIPKWMVLLLFIPFVNIIGIIYILILIGFKLGSLCRKGIFMKIGLMIMPLLFYPLLAFSDIELEESLIVVEETVKKVDFSLAPVDIDLDIELHQALSLNDSAVLEAIMPKVGTKITKKEVVQTPDESLDEHLSKADKEKPTAQDLTFNYNLVYNSKETKEEIVKEVVEEKIEEVEEVPVVEVIAEPEVPETVEEEIDDTPIVPIVHEVNLEMAAPLNVNELGPIPINKRFDNQINANKEKVEERRRIQKEEQERLEEEIAAQSTEEIQLIENGPVELDDSLSGLLANAPDFSVAKTPKKKEKKVEEDHSMASQVKENVPTTEIKNIVRMDIVEPSQLPVGVLATQTENIQVEQPEEVKTEEQPTQTEETQEPISLLRPTSADSNLVQVDKVCPQCSAKLKRDCPVCIICGYKF